MYESVCKNLSEPFILHCLCLDQKTAEVMATVPHVKVYTIDDIRNCEHFAALVQNNESKPNDLSPYHWALASLFTNYVMETQAVHDVLYVDSDILFFNSLEAIYSSVRNSSIGLVAHKHTSYREPVGFFNVGIIYFRNDIHGREALSWWSKTVATRDPLFKNFATCGDQKYLELFMLLFDRSRIKVLDADVGHAAPWNVGKGKILLIDKVLYFDWLTDMVFNTEDMLRQPLIFYHYSHFSPDYTNSQYRIDKGGEWGYLFGDPNVKLLYDVYFQQCIHTKERYKL